MREYELVYVIQPDATPEREQEIHARADGLIEAAGSRVLLRDDWGKRKFAYEIKSFQKGHYFQLNFLGDGSEVSGLERSLRLDQDVLRFLSVQVSADVKDVEARVSEAAEQAKEQARRREERARIEAERELEREQERARMEAERGQQIDGQEFDQAPALADAERASDGSPDLTPAAEEPAAGSAPQPDEPAADLAPATDEAPPATADEPEVTETVEPEVTETVEPEVTETVERQE